MTVYLLDSRLIFPSPTLSEEDGLLAAGGDLSPERLLLAYSNGIFPWYNEDDPILWWSPDPRCVLAPSDVYISKSMKQVLRNQIFSFTVDTAFTDVMHACAGPRRNGSGTWIQPAMIEAYTLLHTIGYAHSIEVWQNKKLVGGLYGLAIDNIFFGESMFSLVPNSSKAAFIYLCRLLEKMDFKMLDCQLPTDHLLSLGAKSMSRKEYLEILKAEISKTQATSFAGSTIDIACP